MLTDDELRNAVIGALVGAPPEEWSRYTYESGHYEITTLRANTRLIARAVEAAVIARRKQQEPVAYMTPDGERTTTAASRDGMLSDGGASASAVRVFTVPLYAAPQPGAIPAEAISAMRGALEALEEVAEYGVHYVQEIVDLRAAIGVGSDGGGE